MPEIENNTGIVSVNEELKNAFIKFNNSYLERFSNIDKSIKSLNSSIDNISKGSDISNADIISPEISLDGFAYKNTLDSIQKKLFSFKEKMDEINSPLFNSFLKYLESTEKLNKSIEAKLSDIENGLGKINDDKKEENGLLDLILKGIGGALKKAFKPILDVFGVLTKNLFTRGILIRAFGASLLGIFGAEIAEKLGMPNWIAKPVAYAAGGFMVGGPWGAVAGAAIGTGVAMYENQQRAEQWKQENPLQWFKDEVIAKGESGGDYNRVVFDLRKNANLTEMSITDILSLQSNLISETKDNPKYAHLLPRGKGTSAVGKYQITKSLLNDFLSWLTTNEGAEFNRQFNISRDTKFDEKTQELIANWILTKRVGLEQYAKGNMSEEEIVSKLHSTWSAAFPSNKPMTSFYHLQELKDLKKRVKENTQKQSGIESLPPSDTTPSDLEQAYLNKDNFDYLASSTNQITEGLMSIASNLGNSQNNSNRDITKTFNINPTPTPGCTDYSFHRTNYLFTGSSYSKTV